MQITKDSDDREIAVPTNPPSETDLCALANEAQFGVQAVRVPGPRRELIPFFTALSGYHSNAEQEDRRFDPNVFTAAAAVVERVRSLRAAGALPRVTPKSPLSSAWWQKNSGMVLSGLKTEEGPLLAREERFEGTSLSILRPADLRRLPAARSWLITELWGDQAVGIIGGPPKSAKTWLSLDMAVSVASGTPCLGRFDVARPGRVIAFYAEDASPMIRSRLESICAARNIDFDKLDLGLIDALSVRLDQPRDRDRLRRLVADERPRMLVLDPFIRLHSGDENDAGHVSRVLGYLRDLQREFETAIVVAHHVRKNHARSAQEGQALRGSGDFYGWLDSGLYPRKVRDGYRLAVEHRAAAAPDALKLALAAEPAPHLVVDSADADEAVEGDTVERTPRSIDEEIVDALTASPTPLSRDEVRNRVRGRTQTISQALMRLMSIGRIRREGRGWMIASSSLTE